MHGSGHFSYRLQPELFPHVHVRANRYAMDLPALIVETLGMKHSQTQVDQELREGTTFIKGTHRLSESANCRKPPLRTIGIPANSAT